MDSIWLTLLLSNDRWLFIEYFLGFVESVCVFYTSMFLVPKRVLLPTLATPPCPLCSDTPTGTTSSFFALRKTPFHSHLYWSGVSLFHLYSPLPFTGLSLGCGPAVHSLLRAVLTVRNITFSSFSASSQPRPKVCQCFRVLLSAHTLQRQLLACSRRTSLSVRSYPPLPLQIRWHVMLSSGRENLTGRRRDESCSTPGSFLRHISAVEVFLENLTDTKLKSKRPCRCPRPL